MTGRSGIVRSERAGDNNAVFEPFIEKGLPTWPETGTVPIYESTTTTRVYGEGHSTLFAAASYYSGQWIVAEKQTS